MIETEKLIQLLSTVEDTIFTDLSDTDRLVIISNLLLNVSSRHLSKHISKDSTSILADGKSVAYELMNNPHDVGLNLAVKAHHVLDLSNKL